jgi:2-polyprenyl-3-methyl-5-hydroxy-6-metoxy-1,4-benzoquinol methylase
LIEDETLGACPLCGTRIRELVHAALTDDSFGVVNGSWPLWRCAGCANAYLDPRPNRETIGQAYQRYFTHAPSAGSTALSWRGRIRRRLEDAYLHRRYGSDSPPSLVGAWAYSFLLPYRQMSDVRYRHLPGPGQGRALLDVGCGSGAFLLLARSCGWQVEGVDPDPRAAAQNLHESVPVRHGGIEVYAGRSACFDLITLSHVVEHVHQPLAVLRDCHRLLKPGGSLWIATPNLDSGGHALFGRHWLGLDAPRHLVLFNERGLKRLLNEAGFTSTRRLTGQLPDPFMLARASYAISQGQLPQDASARLPQVLWWRAWRLALMGWLRPEQREFLYLSANR